MAKIHKDGRIILFRRSAIEETDINFLFDGNCILLERITDRRRIGYIKVLSKGERKIKKWVDEGVGKHEQILWGLREEKVQESG